MCQCSCTLEEAMCTHELIVGSGGIQMCLWGVAWLTCILNVGAWTMLREGSTRASILRCVQLKCHDIGICEMPARATGIGTISTNATGRCAFRLCLFCTGAVHACASPGALDKGRCCTHE